MDYQFEYKVFGNALGINEEYKTLQKDNIIIDNNTQKTKNNTNKKVRKNEARVLSRW